MSTVYPDLNGAPSSEMMGINPAMGAPIQQAMMDYSRLHPAFADDNTARLRYVAYATQKPWDLLACLCGCCSVCKIYQEELRRNHFVAVYDNRIVLSEPSCIPMCQPFQTTAGCDYALCDIRPCVNCCNGRILIRNSVSSVYFDRAVAQNADIPGCCSPACTHFMFCPQHCGYCGESIILHERPMPGCRCKLFGCQPCGQCCTCTVVNQLDAHETASLHPGRMACILCAKRYRMIDHLDDGQRLMQEINMARSEYNKTRTGPIITGLTREEAEGVEADQSYCCK